ncbi:MAG: sigma-70 family RNA polymerase sigma factor [Planctomycetota bacterium]
MHTTSISLLERLRQPDAETAWERFVQLYTPMIYRWAREISLSHDEASDLVQDVFGAVIKKMPTFEYDRTGSFRSWLKTVTSNRARDVVRKLSRQTVDGSAEDQVIAPDDIEFLSKQEYQEALARRALEFAQTEFEPNTWKACWMSVVSDMPAAEIAQELGITVNAVYLAKSRVLRHLRVALSGLMD